jgi:hypothetical protein
MCSICCVLPDLCVYCVGPIPTNMFDMAGAVRPACVHYVGSHSTCLLKMSVPSRNEYLKCQVIPTCLRCLSYPTYVHHIGYFPTYVTTSGPTGPMCLPCRDSRSIFTISGTSRPVYYVGSYPTYMLTMLSHPTYVFKIQDSPELCVCYVGSHLTCMFTWNSSTVLTHVPHGPQTANLSAMLIHAGSNLCYSLIFYAVTCVPSRQPSRGSPFPR